MNADPDTLTRIATGLVSRLRVKKKPDWKFWDAKGNNRMKMLISYHLCTLILFSLWQNPTPPLHSWKIQDPEDGNIRSQQKSSFDFYPVPFWIEIQNKSVRMSQNKDYIIMVLKVLKPYHNLQRSHHYNYIWNCKHRSRVSENSE